MARGGARKGTPGKGYSNRTDLLTDRSPQTGTQTAASAGVPAPAAVQASPQQTWTAPEDVPKLDDPTGRPNEPVTAGLGIGRGPGVEALGYVPPSQAVQSLQAAYLANPTPALRRVIAGLAAKGRI